MQTAAGHPCTRNGSLTAVNPDPRRPHRTPWRERERQKILLGLARLETDLLGTLAQGVPRWRNGKMLCDPQTGQPLRNLNADRSMRATLRKLEQPRFRLTGLPPA